MNKAQFCEGSMLRLKPAHLTEFGAIFAMEMFQSEVVIHRVVIDATMAKELSVKQRAPIIAPIPLKTKISLPLTNGPFLAKKDDIIVVVEDTGNGLQFTAYSVV